MKKINLPVLTLCLITFSSSAMALETSDNLTTTARIENFCSISSNDINFGVVASPLTSQTATGQINILCSNKTPYVTELTYGENAGSTSSGFYTSSINFEALTWSQTYIYDNNSLIGEVGCDVQGRVGFTTLEVANIYGYTVYTIGSTPYDNKSICNGKYFNTTTLSNLSPKNPENGIMKGISKGDKLAYLITVPDDSSKTWAKGFNSYSSIGTGEPQIININAKIVVDKSSSTYIAQDSYLDTVTLTVNY